MQSAGSDSTWFYELLAWVQDHSKQVIAGGIAVLAVVFLGYTYQWKRERTELAANTALVRLTANLDRTPASPNTLQFAAVAEQYPSTSAAERALLLHAGQLYTEGQYGRARETFEHFLRRYSRSSLAPIAAFGIATCLDAQEQVEEAMAAYRRVIAEHRGDPVANQAQLNLAAILESRNQPAEALRLYDELTGGRLFTQAAMDALSRREQLLRRHPELAPAPSTPSPPPEPLSIGLPDDARGLSPTLELIPDLGPLPPPSVPLETLETDPEPAGTPPITLPVPEP